MTKTLTEQWREEELPIDLYYVIDKLGRETIGNDCGIRDMMVDAFNGGNIFIKEVLAPVPSYDHFSQLVKKVELLEFDNDVINSVSEQQDEKIIAMDKEMANMRKQIMQANKCIKHCSTHPCCKKYLEKWGVK